MKKFDIPTFYKSSFIRKIKELRKISDPRKIDFTPTVLDFGAVQFFVARHFGFCFGVENAIEISYRTVEENPGKRVFLLSEMIHNPIVNDDLVKKGIRFLMNTEGEQIIPWDKLTSKDIVLIPAFGTTIELENRLKKIGIQIEQYDTTCPFVKKVWNMSKKLGDNESTVVIHGKHIHEETRATFSHSESHAPSVVVKDLTEAKSLSEFALGQKSKEEFYIAFKGKYSKGFDPEIHFEKVGVVNQTTMLASDTHEIAEFFKGIMEQKFDNTSSENHFVDTRDTLCYATNDNQEATYGLLEQSADFALVVGGYNSSNTSHLVELCERKFQTYYISSSNEIKSENEIEHFNLHNHKIVNSKNWLKSESPLKIILTSGASCPDSEVDKVIDKILSFFDNVRDKEEVISELAKA